MKVMGIYRYQVSKFVFKSINSLAPRNFHGWFQLTHERYGYRTRSNFSNDDDSIIKNLFIPSARTTNYGLKQLRVNGPRIWNSLPTYIKNATSLKVFTKSIIIIMFFPCLFYLVVFFIIYIYIYI